MQVSPLVSRICGTIWNAAPAGTATAHATACTFAVPFKIGVHFDADEADMQAMFDDDVWIENALLWPISEELYRQINYLLSILNIV